jgi:hypothetical protein
MGDENVEIREMGKLYRRKQCRRQWYESDNGKEE